MRTQFLFLCFAILSTFSTSAFADRLKCIKDNAVVLKLSVNAGKVSRIVDYHIVGGQATNIPILAQEQNEAGDIFIHAQVMDTAYYTFNYTLTQVDENLYKLKVRNHYYQKTLVCDLDRR